MTNRINLELPAPAAFPGPQVAAGTGGTPSPQEASCVLVT